MNDVDPIEERLEVVFFGVAVLDDFIHENQRLDHQLDAVHHFDSARRQEIELNDEQAHAEDVGVKNPSVDGASLAELELYQLSQELEPVYSFRVSVEKLQNHIREVELAQSVHCGVFAFSDPLELVIEHERPHVKEEVVDLDVFGGSVLRLLLD